MLAFHNDPAIKEKYLNRVRLHEAQDEIIHGKYWERGKGCAVGCTVHSSSHKAFETELGIPIMLARLEDRLFEGMANGNSKQFPARFLNAITPGSDLSRVGWQFLYWLLTEDLASRDDPRVSKEIKACADVLIPLTKGEPCDRNAADLARRAALEARSKAWTADAAAYAAYAAVNADAAANAVNADAAANAANAANAAYAAVNAAYAAAAYAADAADAAAYAAADAVNAADAAAYAAAARRKCYERMAEKLLQFMADAPVVPFCAGIAA
jgi:hypothetical protein